MRFLLLLFAVFSVSQVVLAQSTVAFYFAAHGDDWQLFMNPDAYNDVQAISTKVVFVYLTAGDSGVGVGKAGRSQPYYLARENGAKVSVMFTADAQKGPPVMPVEANAFLAGHTIKRWGYRNTVSYFLRLPDGNMDGGGYSTTGLQSLKRLHEGVIPSVNAIDGSATYQDWTDLRRMIRALIDQERGGAKNVWVRIPDPDVDKNIGDHSDHQHTARVVLEAIADVPCINKALYLDYAAAWLDENISGPDREIKSGTFAVLSLGLTAMDHASDWDAKHRLLLNRRYVRNEPGVGSCSGSASPSERAPSYAN